LAKTETTPKAGPRAPRLDLYAVVAIKTGKRRVILTVCNLSESGVLLEADEGERGKLPIESVHEISVFDRDYAQHRTVTMKATVVRHEERGVALTWKQDDAAIKKIARLIEQLQPQK
jgi:hypothetical protein